MSKQSEQAKAIFLEALDKHAPDEWPAFLEQACAGDAVLRADVEELLRARAEIGSFHEQPRPAVGPTVDHRTTEHSGTVIGPYRLLEQIGEGGMGLVFVAEQQHPVRRRVALKVVKPGMDSRQVVARFEAERQALAMMDHANIAKIYDGGTSPEGRPYFVMELVKGTPITDYCDTHHLGARQRLELFLDVCHAVQHAHQKGIIHRDLKPSNVLVEIHDVRPVVKVIDFGIAKATGQQLTDKTVYTAVAQMIGTPMYMSPEQAGLSSLDVDTRSDVYSLGVLLYELLTGTTPFDNETLKKGDYDEMRRIIREEEPPRPSTRLSTMRQAALSTIAEKRGLEPRRLSEQLRGELDWIVMKALEKDRNRRYESASAFATDIQRYLNDEPVAACPPSARYRLAKFARRNKTRLAMAALVLFFLIVVGGGGGWLAIDQAARHRGAENRTQESLAGARTAIEAGDLALAGRRVAEAQGHLGADRERSPALAAEIDRLQHELEARQADETCFRQFLKLASDAQDKMGYSGIQGGDSLAKEALNLYGVLERSDWSSRLEDCYLTADQKEQVRETAYVTLVSLADFGVRYSDNSQSSRTSLELLERAGAFHPPSGAFYYVRSECRRLANDFAAADEDVRRFKEAPAQMAWDYYLIGYTEGERGDMEEAMRSFRAALALQPNHYNSLFYLAHQMARDEIKRWPEAIMLLTGCIALRPHDVYAYLARADCHRKLGQLDEAEADYSAAVTAAESEEDRGYAFLRAGRLPEAIAALKDAVEKRKAKLGPDHDRTLTVMEILGEAYVKADRLPEAIALLEPTVEKLKAKLGPDHPGTLMSMNNLGLAYVNAGRLLEAVALLLPLEPTQYRHKAEYDPDHAGTLNTMDNLDHAYITAVGRLPENIPLLEEALKIQKAKYGPDHADTFRIMHNLGRVYVHAGRLPEAIALLEPTVEKLKAMLGPDHPDTLTSMAHLGIAYEHAGRLPEAIALLEPTVEKRKAMLGPDHPDTLTNMNNLADAYQKAGRLPEAIALFKDTVEKLKAKLGPENERTLQSMLNLGITYEHAGRLPEAIALLKDMVEKCKAKLGPDNDWTLISIAHLGNAYVRADRLPEAIALLEPSLEKLKAKLGPDYTDTLMSMRNLAQAYSNAGRLPEAIVLFETVEKRRAMLDPDHPDTLVSMNNLALAYWRARQLDRSVPLFEEALKRYEQKLGPDHPDTLNAQANLGVNYRDAGRLEDGIALLEEAIDRAGKLPGGFPATLAWVPAELAWTYDRAGLFAKAEPLYRAALTDAKQRHAAEHPEVAGLLANVGKNLLMQKKYADAEPILRECLAIREKNEPEAWFTFNTRSMLGASLLGQGKHAEAEPLLVEGYDGMKQREAVIPPAGKIRLTEAAERLVRFYEATDQPDKAGDWRRELEAISTALKQP